MILYKWLGWMFGWEGTESIEQIRPALAATWAREHPVWLFGAFVAVTVVAVLFYVLGQGSRRVFARALLTVLLSLLLCLLVLILAEPVLCLQVSSRLRPTLWVLIDGTDSMAIRDELPSGEAKRLADAVGLPDPQPAGRPAAGRRGAEPPERIDYVRAWLSKGDQNVLERLEQKCRVRVFLFDRLEGVRALETPGEPGTRIDGKKLAAQLSTDGEVTALGAALEDVTQRQAVDNLAGVVIVSDFNENAGPAAVSVARRWQGKVPLFTVGVGPVAAADLAVDLQAPPVMKKDERVSLVATVRQEGYTGQTVQVKFLSRRMGGSGPPAEATLLGQREVTLAGAAETAEFPYVPRETGQFQFSAEVEPMADETVRENNRAERECTVHDQSVRLLFVEYEPTWEWRFVKEVFHRDRLVGKRGFRTFLRSADPKVRQSNPLFLAVLPSDQGARAEFFTNDVIVLGDMPASALSPGFCRMTEEFVGKFGGGLVVVAGPRFGPGQLAETPLAELLPVKVDPGTRLRDDQEFLLRRTSEAPQYDFMRLGSSDAENERAWSNLGPLSWYQPVQRLHPLAVALAEHPTDTCVDGKTPQPIIAARNYGRGEVIYIGFDETWRLRRRYGELYYRQFWGQMIHRLALRHALGAQKRFVVRTDRRQYQSDDQAIVTVEAYNANFEPLGEDKLPGRKLVAELIVPEGQDGPSAVRPISVAQLREGVFETRIPVFAAGEHRVRVKDPITGQYSEVTFRVASVAVERQRAVRSAALQEALAVATGGKTYDLATAARLPDEIQLVSRTESRVEEIPLWNTWPCFVVVLGLMLGGWAVRKWVNMP